MPEAKMSKQEGEIKYPGTDPEEIKKEAIGRVPEKVQKKIAKKVAACIATGLVLSTGGFIALGETGNLPEPVQEWYDETSQPIRKMFGIEEASEELTHLVSEAESKEFTGLEIEGLNHVWQNNRWEYVDSEDGLVAGYWDGKEGKFELTANELRGEWKGLFVSQSLEEVRSKLKEDEEWTKENWENGELKVPIGFDITKGGIVEEIKALSNFIRGSKTGTVMGIRDLLSGTVIFSPLSSEDTGLSIAWSTNSASFNIDKNSIFLSFNFRNTSQCLIPDNGYPDNPYNGPEYISEYRLLFLGYPILEVDNNDVLPKIATAVINPFLKENYQVLISSNQEGGGPINFSFENLLRDEKGRFVFINPSSSEVEEMKSATEEEVKKVELEAEKKALEEKIETSSLIEKSETAPTIDGLELDKETGFYFAKEINDYDLKKDTKAGVFKNGFLGLIPEVINFLQLQREGFQPPLPFNPIDASGLELVEEKIIGEDYVLIRLPKEMTIYSPVNGLCYRGGREIYPGPMAGPMAGSYQTLFFDLEGIEDFTIFSKEIKYVSFKEKVEIGDKLGEVKQDVFIKIRFDNILKIGDNNLVFILPND